MSRHRDRLIAASAFVLLAAIGILVLLLVNDAAKNGRRALERSLLGEVQAIARSQNSRVVSQLSGASGLAADDWDLERDSAGDLERLNEILELVPDLPTGFFLTDLSGVITQGVQLEDRSMIGERYVRTGFSEVFDSPVFAAGGGAVLPVGSGVTTDVPTIAFVYPIFGQEGVRGSFVFESQVAPDSDFNAEIGALNRGDTGAYLVYDLAGRIIAANDPSLVGESVPDDVYVETEPGLRTVDGMVLVVDDIPAASWRIAFSQDRSEFLSGLAGPLQQVGQVVIVAFVVIGAALAVALARRLRAAREEQARLRRLAESQEEFISIVSHELRTPVAGVLGFLQTTMDHWDSMSETERFNAVRRSASNARRLQGLTRDVLDSQSVESGRMAYVMSEADLREEVGVAVEAARGLYPAVQFETEFEIDEAPALIDVDRIQQVLTNLLDNAARVTPPEEPIAVRLWREGDRVRVSVADRGPGLAPDLVDRVFDKFVRGSTSAVTGTGLGLYIARQIVDAHRGSISVTSEPGQGAIFVFDVPLLTAAISG